MSTEPRHYPYTDTESGEIILLSEKQYKGMQWWREKMLPITDQSKLVKGSIIITSTMADDSNSENLKDLWYSSNQSPK